VDIGYSEESTELRSWNTIEWPSCHPRLVIRSRSRTNYTAGTEQCVFPPMGRQRDRRGLPLFPGNGPRQAAYSRSLDQIFKPRESKDVQPIIDDGLCLVYHRVEVEQHVEEPT